jgi:hypothetical protein
LRPRHITHVQQRHEQANAAASSIRF